MSLWESCSAEPTSQEAREENLSLEADRDRLPRDRLLDWNLLLSDILLAWVSRPARVDSSFSLSFFFSFSFFFIHGFYALSLPHGLS